MSDGVPSPVSNSNQSRIPAEHARHDRLIVTRFAGADPYPSEAGEARALIAACHDCARLADDIRLLMSATSALPAPRRTRDFRLTPEHVADLRGSFLERLLRPLVGPRVSPLRPLAGVAMSLGLALAVAGIALPTAAPAAAPRDVGALQMTATQAPDKAGGEPAPAAAPGVGSAEVETGGIPEDNFSRAYSEDLDGLGEAAQASQPADQTRAILLYAGLALATLSLAVLLLVTFARRRAYDRLLR